jgi:ADP-ribose pyrophosphatase
MAAPPNAAQIATRRIHSGRIIQLDMDTVRLPNGRTAEMDIVRHPGASAVLPVLRRTDVAGKSEILLLRQYRYAAGGELFEIPAGRLDGDESPAACAARELTEETGYTADSIDLMYSMHTTPGFSDELIHVFIADGLHPGETAQEEDEFMTIESVTMDRALRLIQEGRMTDAKSALAILHANAFRGLK